MAIFVIARERLLSAEPESRADTAGTAMPMDEDAFRGLLTAFELAVAQRGNRLEQQLGFGARPSVALEQFVVEAARVVAVHPHYRPSAPHGSVTPGAIPTSPWYRSTCLLPPARSSAGHNPSPCDPR